MSLVSRVDTHRIAVVVHCGFAAMGGPRHRKDPGHCGVPGRRRGVGEGIPGRGVGVR